MFFRQYANVLRAPMMLASIFMQMIKRKEKHSIRVSLSWLYKIYLGPEPGYIVVSLAFVKQHEIAKQTLTNNKYKY